ncbi:alpha-N-arabinofuranosidase [Mucilaginibacter sp. HMF5004]|uniref:alpha-L-arabinofuranosidase C-terminal domain-containing protein n=1 Tax=Mucilaginibacter rivuli TaxID=2857527 RepID=UPI001C5EED6A|nr:alpha-L-arabinofuranosidase C-terminal domain-containing protein [Mucilaginibacter rivuli]MBW4889340.1 alpha-N-arabinofuranosidase [Mucilaginibacter rivuli]
MRTKFTPALIVLSLFNFAVIAQNNPPIVLKIDAAKAKAKVSPTLYGIMTEEINHSYDGGIYAELIQNRIFKDDNKAPAHWSLIGTADLGSISLENNQRINDSLTVCLKLSAANASKGNRVGFANDGYWGIPIRPKTTYHASFYAKGDALPFTVSLESNDGKVLATATIKPLIDKWKQYSVTLTTGADVAPSANNKLVIATQQPGVAYFNLVSLFPPTYKDRKNGNRIDIMQKLADLHPTFLRCPGGNYVEGNTMATYYDWKKTIHDLSLRPGHPGTWKYRSTDGMGILEYMTWCEDLKIQPVLAVFAGYTLNKEYVDPAGPQMKKFVQDALDEIEYITGDATTKWGAERVLDGHPAPFALTYVEIGNEDFFDKSGSYDGRYAQMHDAIKAKYPKLQLIATTKVTSRVPDLVDDHFYKLPQEFEKDIHHYDNAPRNGPKIFVGEWAARIPNPVPTPNMACALGDAAWMTGMERNTDLILMASYAPLFVNVNPGAMQWRINMIGYDAMTSYGSPSYYAQQMFYQNIGDVVLTTEMSGIPDVPYIPAPPRRAPGDTTKPKPVVPQTMQSLSYVVTKDTKKGIVYLKVVNIMGSPQAVQINIDGVSGINANGTAITLAGKPEDTNTITDPEKIIPVNTTINGLNKNFSYTFAANSVTVLQLHVKN